METGHLYQIDMKKAPVPVFCSNAVRARDLLEQVRPFKRSSKNSFLYSQETNERTNGCKQYFAEHILRKQGVNIARIRYSI